MHEGFVEQRRGGHYVVRRIRTGNCSTQSCCCLKDWRDPHFSNRTTTSLKVEKAWMRHSAKTQNFPTCMLFKLFNLSVQPLNVCEVCMLLKLLNLSVQSLNVMQCNCTVSPFSFICQLITNELINPINLENFHQSHMFGVNELKCYIVHCLMQLLC